MGIGKKDLNPIETQGCTWQWRDASGSNYWDTSGGDIIANKTIAAEVVSFKSTQQIEYNRNDIDMDVTTTIERQLDGSIPNHGFVIKHLDANETSSVRQYGSSKFFSRDTHTIYVPRLEVGFDDSSFDAEERSKRLPWPLVLSFALEEAQSITKSKSAMS